MDRRGSTHGDVQPRLPFDVASGGKAAPDTQPFTADITVIAQLGRCEQRRLMVVAPERVRIQEVHNALLGSARQKISIPPAEPHRARRSHVQIPAIQKHPVGRQKIICQAQVPLLNGDHAIGIIAGERIESTVGGRSINPAILSDDRPATPPNACGIGVGQ